MITRLAEVKKAIRAARDPKFTHARSRQWCGEWIASRRAARTSPLSPTEGL